MKAKKPNYPRQTIMVNDACNSAKTNNFWTKKYFTTDFFIVVTRWIVTKVCKTENAHYKCKQKTSNTTNT